MRETHARNLCIAMPSRPEVGSRLGATARQAAELNPPRSVQLPHSNGFFSHAGWCPRLRMKRILVRLELRRTGTAGLAPCTQHPAALFAPIRIVLLTSPKIWQARLSWHLVDWRFPSNPPVARVGPHCIYPSVCLAVALRWAPIALVFTCAYLNMYAAREAIVSPSCTHCPFAPEAGSAGDVTLRLGLLSSHCDCRQL